MTRKILLVLSLPFFLTGCIGSCVRDGNVQSVGEEFPDIRSVPTGSQEEAMRKNDAETQENREDLQALEKLRKQIKEREEALRKKTNSELKP